MAHRHRSHDDIGPAEQVADEIHSAAGRLRRWGELRDWQGYDPYDALNSPLARALTLQRPFGRRLLTQAVKLSPLNLRPLLGIRPAWNAKALGLVASAYARLWAAEGDKSTRGEAERWLTWLAENHSATNGDLAWGYHFEVQTRVFSYARGTPNTIATAFVCQALLDGFELIGDDGQRENVLAAVRFLERELLVRDERAYFSYLPGEPELIHNANLLACAVLARTARLIGKQSLVEVVEAAIRPSLDAQQPDGSWPYAEGPGYEWVDNFHTAYVLESLAECEKVLPQLREPLDRGVQFWARELFLSDGTPKYSVSNVYPLDAHCYASAIDTWISLIDRHPQALVNAERLATLLVERMLDPSGYIYFQQRRGWTNKVPFVRWTTAPAFRALAGLLLARERSQANAVEDQTYARLD